MLASADFSWSRMPCLWPSCLGRDDVGNAIMDGNETIADIVRIAPTVCGASASTSIMMDRYEFVTTFGEVQFVCSSEGGVGALGGEDTVGSSPNT